MGIPFYFYVITRTHPGILLQSPPANPTALYLDFNGAIYQAVKKLSDAGIALTDELVAQETIVYLEWLTDAVTAGKPMEVGVCLDGVAPRAKMMQQRKRRFMGMFRTQMEKDAGLLKEGATAWDTCAISPGTAFMGIMAQHLRSYAEKTKNVWVSPADEPGEGEHKIFQRMAKATGGGGEPTLIYGLDADLIMLSLVSHRPNIYLMREPTQAGIPPLPAQTSHTSHAKSLASAPDPSPFIYVNIDALRAGILSTIRQHYQWPISKDAMSDTYSDEAKMWIETYIVLCFLLGNDFLPPLPALTLKSEGLETLLQAYGRILKAYPGSALIDGGNISWEVLGLLLEDLAKDEDKRVYSACVSNIERRSHGQSRPMDIIEFYPSIPQNRDPVAHAIATGTTNGSGTGGSSSTSNWRLTYYMGLFDSRRANVPQVMRESTMAYLKGMPWIFSYYTQRPKDPKWFYPYGYAPTIRDLVNTIHAEKVVLIRQPTKAAQKEHEFVEPTVQLLSILPPTSISLLPPLAQKFMQDDAAGCRHFYPSRFKVHTFLKTRLWECHPKLPVLDVDWIETRYKNHES